MTSSSWKRYFVCVIIVLRRNHLRARSGGSLEMAFICDMVAMTLVG
jgi:hypothetical protein